MEIPGASSKLKAFSRSFDPAENTRRFPVSPASQDSIDSDFVFETLYQNMNRRSGKNSRNFEEGICQNYEKSLWSRSYTALKIPGARPYLIVRQLLHFFK